MHNSLVLSICIATYNRGGFIIETLDSILPQLKPNVELIVVDGCSPDNTEQVMREYVAKHPEVRYYRELENSGIDKDYDKAVGYAHGEYCWLMTDDDLVKPNALNNILSKLDGTNDLVVVNAEIATVEFSRILDSKLIKIDSDQSYQDSDRDRFMSEIGHGLSFIGCVIVKRDLWLARERSSYYGSLFIHVGVIFQQPILNGITLIADPIISIRYGNAMWTPRGFEIWLIKWPSLIWSFKRYSSESKSIVCPQSNLKKLKKLVFYRATGAYRLNEFRKFLSPSANLFWKFTFLLIVLVPPKVMNVLATIYCALRFKSMQMPIYSLINSKYKNTVSLLISRMLGL
ncbi:MAG: glycosyl transferase [Methylotenera sp.]|jgi:glycosyltransferase involved in cell wall biosynthesis|nr:MAG: glycosyl transferase [Methylotenera sp.]